MYIAGGKTAYKIHIKQYQDKHCHRGKSDNYRYLRCYLLLVMILQCLNMKTKKLLSIYLSNRETIGRP